MLVKVVKIYENVLKNARIKLAIRRGNGNRYKKSTNTYRRQRHGFTSGRLKNSKPIPYSAIGELTSKPNNSYREREENIYRTSRQRKM